MLEKITSYILIIATIVLVLQEQFLVEKIPFSFFYSTKLLLKTLNIRANFGETRTCKDLIFLFVACFGKKIIFDLAFYQIHLARYLQYIVVLICIDYVLLLLSKNKCKSKTIIKSEPIKTFLTLASGISDSISLENLLWRNSLGNWHLPWTFFFVIVDPLLLTFTAWAMKGQKKEKNYRNCQKALTFGAFITLAHFIFARDNYSKLIQLRRKIPLNSSNVMTLAVGIRLLNCVAYILMITFDIVQSHFVKGGPVMIKDNVIKDTPSRKGSDTLSTASTVINFDEEDEDDIIHKPSLVVKRARSD